MKNFTRFLFLSLCILFFTSAVKSGDLPGGIKLIKDGNGYRVEFSLPKYIISSVRGDNNVYSLINVPGYGITSETGLPQLPQISFFMLVGKGEQLPKIINIAQNNQTFSLKSRIYPKQMPWEKNMRIEDRPFVINEGYYNSKGSSDGPFAVVSEPFIIGGAKGVMVTIYPFAYNPSKNEVTETRTGSFKIDLQNSPVLDFSPGPAMDEFIGSVFANYEAKNTKGTNNYLIITASDYESGLAPFVTHKQGLGYNVTVVNTSVTGTTNTSIKAYIQNLYNNVSTRPEFVLLVGDVDKIPEWIGGGEGTPHTDWNYGLLDGNDLWVDAFVGRFPVTNLTQLSNMITKTIYMENGVNNLWKKNVFMASNDNYSITEGTHNFVIDSFFVPHNFTVNTKLYTHSGATTSQISQSIDSGKVFAIYSGHGSETSWADGPVFTQSNVNALNNSIFPFVYSFACVTGSYHISGECFAETWVRSPKGGVIYWGSSVNSYWDEDDILERRMERALFTDNLKRNSENEVKGKIYLVQYYGSITSTMQRYLEMYNCMGDPSIYQLAYGPSITHTPLPNTENLSGPYVVNCVVSPSGSAITGTKLFWTRASAFDSVAMTNSSGNNWTCNIPGNGASAVYKYFIKTQDALGRVTSLPGGAPANFFTFTASPDLEKPVITHTALVDIPKTVWPATLTANVTDNIGIDSVWVRWYKNNAGTGTKEFKLPNTGGSIYSALFNSINSDVTIGDSIFYRVIAQDISSSHNRDSSALNKFKITNVVSTNMCITKWIPIRDNVTTYDSVQVGTHSNIIKVNFTMVNLIHTYDGDVTFALRSPNGTEVVLTSGNGSGGDNYINTVFNDSASTPIASGSAPFTGTFLPTSPLSAFNGQDAYGWWRFRVTDDAGSDTGHVGQYCIQIYSGGTLTGISNTGILPAKYELSQNYPNPFNPTTKINFAIPKQGLVTMKIYDVLGREVRTLVNEVKTAGNYTVDFNASELSSGVYFYRLESNDFTDVKRMILIK